jgi:molecular chaperone GrpE
MSNHAPSTDNQASHPDTSHAADAAASLGDATVTAGQAQDQAIDATTELQQLRAQVTELSDAYLRAKAETENIRRRSEDEAAKTRKFAIEGFAESLLPVRDSLEAALALPNASPEQMLEGVQATLRQLTQALERHKVVPIDPPAGTRFDPHHHQAISMVPAPQDPNTVVGVLQKGYLIAERVLRPALVTVAAPQ